MNIHSAGEVLEKSTVKVAWWPMRRLCFWLGVVRSPSFGLFSTPLNPTSYVIELEKSDKNIARTWKISAHATFFTSDEPIAIRWISCVSFSGKNNLFSGRNQFKKETPFSILWFRSNNKTWCGLWIESESEFGKKRVWIQTWWVAFRSMSPSEHSALSSNQISQSFHKRKGNTALLMADWIRLQRHAPWQAQH